MSCQPEGLIAECAGPFSPLLVLQDLEVAQDGEVARWPCNGYLNTLLLFSGN